MNSKDILYKAEWMRIGYTDQFHDLKVDLDNKCQELVNKNNIKEELISVFQKHGYSVDKKKPLNKREGKFKDYSLESYLYAVAIDTSCFIKEIVINDILWVFSDYGYFFKKD